MNRIKLLPEQVANQIAAGEVVERPASVVKELVENSLDAGAKKISIEIQAGGRSLVRVADDGIGMSRDDALLCLERHATSKIRRAEDLAAIATMGFRGEALPSIASVSKFTLTTRERDDQSPEGTQITIAGGTIGEVKAAGAAPGTSIEVRQLFFNLPARRKFLRTEETEAAHIQHYLTLAALAFPDVAFTFQKDGRLVWQLPAVKSGPAISSRIEALRERLRALLGDEKLLAVNFSASLEEDYVPEQPEVFENAAAEKSPPEKHASAINVWGLIGALGVSRATRESQFVFVNRRPVENRGINYALIEGCHTTLMKGRFPVCCLFLEIDPAAVDVNVHPAKREVKFHRESEIRKFVAQAIREALLAFHSQPEKKPDLPKPAVEQSLPIDGPIETNIVPALSTPALPEFPLPLRAPDRSLPPATQTPLPMGFSRTVPRSSSATATVASPAAPPPAPSLSSATPLLNVPLRLVGVIGKLYVVLESDRGLVLLDQHAAHERILFEQMLNRLEQNEFAPTQKLLLPETIELSPRDANFLREQLAPLTRLGVGLSEFGERTFLLDALPAFVKAADTRRFVLDLVDELKAAGREVNLARLGEHTIAKTVCRHAVKANDPLAGPELENLVEDLRHCAMPYTCPHGRPTLIEMSYRELEKKFGRTQ
ncbi:MAG TPA: DNA mismatch repair endonuclease MutL [Candidatus Acidoferrales bacterium]|jgi:DNA mismatch repair protein MutL|nr:DNA mismatch repair endonuclease MutL [Candidatus Acidoferrales bacterium]